ncbi:hypothetical protein SAMN05444397_103293 [Flavobacterium aquidurense]|uniref:Uncharacterized protein n=1 Tax=Flavobacterium frigidimaris TaxID=262320 RepID=A0ABX4BUH8_FLAFR|nr:hypothetical protein [Flavobacterium frigidimaris]OXA80803.1 hypothetical protein B0A65_05735 [Flavobacterium frigidimaris]SDZ06750.1 hypothetical protein SAMN05444397_103293 [Flavobacterium aquidurense]
MNKDELNKKSRILSDIVKKLDISETSRNFEQRIVAGRATPTPSFSIKPKEVIVKPTKDDEK